VDGLIYASSMAMLNSARRGIPAPVLARWLLGLDIAATLAANVAHGLGEGPVGAVVGAWPAVALVGSYELLMVIIRSAQMPADAAAASEVTDTVPGDGPVHARAAQAFADEVATGRVPSVRAIRARLHVGQPRAQRIRAYLAVLANAQPDGYLQRARTRLIETWGRRCGLAGQPPCVGQRAAQQELDLGVCAAQFVGGPSGQGVMNGRIQLSLSVADRMVER
jgi:hypothetical protein